MNENDVADVLHGFTQNRVDGSSRQLAANEPQKKECEAGLNCVRGGCVPVAAQTGVVTADGNGANQRMYGMRVDCWLDWRGGRI